MPRIALGAFSAQLTERTRFFDAEVVAAIESGVTQVVIVGAGYDDRALRFRTTGVRFFEVDHPATQADKRTRLEAIGDGPGPDGPVLVSADLAREDVASALEESGHDSAAATLFVCEGVLVYLEREAISRSLRSLSGISADGSLLAASLATHSDGLDSALVRDAANARRSTSYSEPWLTILPKEEHLDLLRTSGWTPRRLSGTETTLVVASRSQATGSIAPDASTGRVGD